MKWYVYEFQNTKDGTFNFAPDNLDDKQLCFDIHEPPKGVKFVEYESERGFGIGEKEAIKLFEKKYDVKCKWSSIGYGKQNHLAYKIIENWHNQ